MREPLPISVSSTSKTMFENILFAVKIVFGNTKFLGLFGKPPFLRPKL